MLSEESDVEMKSSLPKKSKKTPKSPTAETLKESKKLTTKEMIQEALVELKSRKGTSLFAIKKYLELKYNVDVEKIKHIIKKYLVSSVEDGTIIQTKGIGASGSFKLVVNKEKAKKKEKIEKNSDKKKTENKKTEKKEKKNKPKLKKADSFAKGEKQKKVESQSITDKKENKKKTIKQKKKIEKGVKTPAKKRAAMMKRKSIGSIIKPPKMKPTAKRAAV